MPARKMAQSANQTTCLRQVLLICVKRIQSIWEKRSFKTATTSQQTLDLLSAQRLGPAKVQKEGLIQKDQEKSAGKDMRGTLASTELKFLRKMSLYHGKQSMQVWVGQALIRDLKKLKIQIPCLNKHSELLQMQSVKSLKKSEKTYFWHNLILNPTTKWTQTS
jgi:hypothetical protein